MHINRTLDEREEQARDDLAKKMRLELLMLPAIRSYFARVRRDFKTFYKEMGIVIDSEVYNEQVVEMLETQYQRVIRRFSNSLIDGHIVDIVEEALKNPINSILLPINSIPTSQVVSTVIDFIKEKIKNSITTFAQQAAILRASFITQTTQKEVNKAVDDVISDASEDNQVLTQDEVANNASDKLKVAFDARVDMIALTETQHISEATKLIEASTIASVTATTPNKQWVTKGDDRVRPAHRAAEGQKRPIAIPFEVGGERLMVPGDTSLGASVENIIRCRCAAVYIF